ncbi:MAG TPA: ubiquitin-like protein Pup, partial [Acidimicrobiales bacterium]|nr:ubiquitin-like protein Pup [Acidimicrobiales bacterium]
HGDRKVAEREQKHRTPSRSETPVEADSAARAESGDKIKSELDDLLDEIDDVLEENAEEFVKSYVQKGGE